MSQQHEMEFADMSMDEPESAYQGYRGPSYHDYANSNEQRAQERLHFANMPDFASGVHPTFMMQMRLGLIIVSLILWVIVFFGTAWAITQVPGALAFILYPMFFLGMIVFTVLVLISNFLF